jgi:hypothetical protein
MVSALSTIHIHHPGNIPGTHFCYRLSRLHDHGAKNPNGTSDLPVGGAVPQQTAPTPTATRSTLFPQLSSEVEREQNITEIRAACETQHTFLLSSFRLLTVEVWVQISYGI